MAVKGELISGLEISDAKEFSAEGTRNDILVPCQPPPCRGCKPCVSCNGYKGVTAEVREKAPVK